MGRYDLTRRRVQAVLPVLPLVYRRAWPTRQELEMEVCSYIEGFYNPRRRHSRLGNLSPATYEQQITTQNEVCG
jgi:transposase InsO family protein